MTHETKWTPGKWTVAPPWSGFSEIRGPNGELIFGLAAGGEKERQPDEVCEANAALIGAAPDLYEALERAFVALGRAGGNTTDSPLREAWLNARTALSKARGEPA